MSTRIAGYIDPWQDVGFAWLQIRVVRCVILVWSRVGDRSFCRRFSPRGVLTESLYLSIEVCLESLQWLFCFEPTMAKSERRKLAKEEARPTRVRKLQSSASEPVKAAKKAKDAPERVRRGMRFCTSGFRWKIRLGKYEPTYRFPQVTVWWPPTKEKRKTEFSGMLWPANVVREVEVNFDSMPCDRCVDAGLPCAQMFGQHFSCNFANAETEDKSKV